VRESDVFTFFDLHAACAARDGTVAPPVERDDPTSGVALKFDSRLDRRGNRHPRSGEELVAVDRIQRPNLTGFIKRDKLTGLVESDEFVPQLEVHERIRLPAIHAGVFTENLLVKDAH